MTRGTLARSRICRALVGLIWRVVFWFQFCRRCVLRPYHALAIPALIYGILEAGSQVGHGPISIAWIFSLVTFLMLAWDVTRYMLFDPKRIYAQDTGNAGILSLRVSPSYRDDYEKRDFPELSVLVSRSVNSLLRATPVTLHLRQDCFVANVGTEIRRLILRRESRRGAGLRDSRKVRLCSDLLPSRMKEECAVTVQPTTYFQSLYTNENIALEVCSTDHPEHLTIHKGLSFAAGGGSLLDLEHSGCSNHIGASTLAWTRDGFVIATPQTEFARVDASKLLSTGSGSADWNDVVNARTLQELVRIAMERELREECCIDDAVEIVTCVTGFARFLQRGGKPEFFGVSLIPLRRDELGVSTSESVFVVDHLAVYTGLQDHAELIRQLSELKSSRESTFSPDLRLSVEFAVELIRDDPATFRRLVGTVCTP